MTPGAETDLARLAEQFRRTRAMDVSPLYRRLLTVAADHQEVLRLVADRRPGQQPSFLLLAAVHDLLLDGVEDPLGQWYGTVAGAAAARRDPAGVDGPFLAFCATYGDRLAAIARRRLVQTNSVRRSLALRLGLARVAALTREPVHLLEIGASAGLNLLFDRYAYRVGDTRLPGPASAVEIAAERRGPFPLADPGPAAAVASRRGADLNPLDLSDPADRRWLRALVWPDQAERLRLLDAAVALAAVDPPVVHRIDVTDPAADPAPLGLPPGATRVVFHSATRMHIPPELADRFDRGVDRLGAGGPVFLVTMEPDGPAAEGLLRVRDPDGNDHVVAAVEGHLLWVAPRPGPQPVGGPAGRTTGGAGA